MIAYTDGMDDDHTPVLTKAKLNGPSLYIQYNICCNYIQYNIYYNYTV